ncbi:MAG: DUF1045 domain-containing protein [Sulfitobacter sp.]
MFERYAIFYTPEAGPFADLMAAWLGWNSATGQPTAQPVIAGLDVARLTARPRKYGFHATLKAPFNLAANVTPLSLKDAVDIIAQRHAAVSLGTLDISARHGFLALRPKTAPTGLRDLAAAIVTELDRFRAPLTTDDIVRRRKSRLTARQNQQMLEWGYPHIFDDFHFHMTLTGPLRHARQETVIAQLQERIAPVLPSKLRLEALTLMGQDTQGMFHQIHRTALRAR